MKIYTNPNSMPKERTVCFVRNDEIHTGTIIGFTDARDMTYAIIDKADDELVQVPVVDCDWDREQAMYGHYRTLVNEVKRLRILEEASSRQRDAALLEAATLRARCIAHGISIEMPEDKTGA